MKTVLEIGSREYVLPQKDAIAVMNAMSKAIRVEVDWSEAYRKGNGDHRRHFVVQEHQDLIQIKQVEDDQIHVPAELAKPAPAKPVKHKPRQLGIDPRDIRMLGFSGEAGAR